MKNGAKVKAKDQKKLRPDRGAQPRLPDARQRLAILEFTMRRASGARMPTSARWLEENGAMEMSGRDRWLWGARGCGHPRSDDVRPWAG
jgi:hypothetical protein